MRIVCTGFAIILAGATAASAAPITIGGFTFSGGDAAFAHDAFLVSGTIRFTCATAAAGPAAPVAEALAGHDLERCINNNLGNSGIVEAVSLDSSIENALGVDLVIFELSGVAPGALVDGGRLHIFIVGLGTKSADIAALGALNSGAAGPEPSTRLLLLGGLIRLDLVRRSA